MYTDTAVCNCIYLYTYIYTVTYIYIYVLKRMERGQRMQIHINTIACIHRLRIAYHIISYHINMAGTCTPTNSSIPPSQVFQVPITSPPTTPADRPTDRPSVYICLRPIYRADRVWTAVDDDDAMQAESNPSSLTGFNFRHLRYYYYYY